MKSFLRTFLIAGIPFGTVMGLVIGLEKGWSGIYWGIGEGFFFGFAIAVISRFQENRAIDSPPVLTDETLVREERATFQIDNRGVIGRLYLTDRRLLFEGIDKNKPFEMSIPIHDILGAEVVKVMGILPNRLRIRTKDERVETFLTDNVSLWVEDITRRREEYLAAPRSESMRLFS